MAFSIKPRLSGENSIITALAAAALVVGVYQAKIGPLADAQISPSNDPNLLASIKKAGWQALGLVAAVTLLAQDPNILILGGATVVAEELSYRHAIMASPDTGQITVTPASYLPAGGQQAQAQQAPSGGYASGILEAVAG
jgi:hypothetical protein